MSGLTLLVDSGGSDSELFTYLNDLGMEPDFKPGLGVSVPARNLTRLTNSELTIIPSEAVRPLWLLATNPPPSNIPATVERNDVGYLISWESVDGVPYDEIVGPSVAPLLGFTELPIVATDDVWLAIEQAMPSIGPSGTASLCHEGYVTISTTKPQVLESSSIPGLFRVSATSFGVCAAYAGQVEAEQGIRWSGPRPGLRPPAIAVPAHLSLAPHIRADLPRVVSDLSTLNAKAIVWESGLGRRVLALAALEVLDAYPTTVLCTPQSIWLWLRHVEMVGRSCGMLSEHADVQIITYHDLPLRQIEPQSIVFDDLASDEAYSAWPALQKLGYLTDTLRVAIEDEWPEDPESSRRLMEILRPAEFRTDTSLAERYPIDPVRRLAEHVEVYLARRGHGATPDLRAFRRSSVRVVALTTAQESAIALASARAGSRTSSQILAEVLELVSAGPANALSPKIAAAAEMARSAHARDRSVAVVTRHRRAAQLIRSMLRPLSCSTLEAPPPLTAVPRVPVAIVRYEHLLPDLRAFDEVVVVDYPWSFSILEHAIGASTEESGPDVVVLHASGSVDDRLSVLAARRSELGEVSDGTVPPDASDIAYLLAPRR